jgi:arylsulfatase A-like enzyme
MALAAGALAAACTRQPEPQASQGPPRHLLLITVDTLRADHLSAYGYARDTSPWLAAAAANGILFEQAISQWPKTGPSFASLFTGQYPQTTGLTHNAAIRIPDEYLTLPELLQQAGFTTVAVNSNGVLSRDLGWDRGFDEYLQTWDLAPEVTDDPVEYRKTMNARRVNELAEPLLERYRDAERLFAWIHYSDPHAPYILPEDVENPFLGDEHYVGTELAPLDDPQVAIGDHRELRYYQAQYDGNVRFADAQIGKLVEHARSLGLLDNAVVVFSADHGESLGEHDYFFGHGRQPYNQGAHVPLVVWLPGGRGGGQRVPGPVELVDLYPTLRDLVLPDREVPGLEGDTLLPLLGAASELPPAMATGARLAYSEAGGGSPTTHFRSVQSDAWKLIYHPRFQHRRQEVPQSWELYHLADDPGETINRVADRPPALRELRAKLEAWMKGSEWIRRDRSAIEAHSQETAKALKALGYVD